MSVVEFKGVSKIYQSGDHRQKALDNDNNRRAIAMLKVMATQDLSLSEMARRLNEEGFVTSRGKKFSAWQVSILLKRYNLK